MTDQQTATILTISGAVVFGMVLALLGSTKLALAKQFDLSGRRISGLLATFNLALIPLMLAAGYLVDRWSTGAVMVLGSVLTTAAIIGIGRTGSYRGAIAAVLMLGCGAAAISTATIKLMPLSFFPAHTAQALCLGHVFIALGALLTPVVADLLIQGLGFRRAAVFLGILCLVPALICAMPPFWSTVSKLTAEHAAAISIFERHKLWQLMLAGAVFFFYAPLEGSLSVWVTTYLTELGSSERRASWVLTGFWGALLGSRLLTAFIPFSDGWYPWLIVILAGLTTIVLGNLAASGDTAAPRRGLVFVGFLLGPIFPILVAVLWNAFPRELGLAYGSVFAMGSIGALMLAPLVSVTVRKETETVHSPFRVAIAIALALTMTALVFGLEVGRGK